MDIKNGDQKIAKSLLIIILAIILLASIFLFIDSFKKEYNTYTQIDTIYNDVRKTDSDGDILIRIETEDGIFRISNIISNLALFNEINTTFSDGDDITIYYYGTNNALGIDKGNYTVLEVSYSINKLEKNDRLSIVIFPVIFIVSIGGILYTILHKKVEVESIKPERTLKLENVNSKKIIRQKVPLYLIIIHSIAVLCSFLFIPYLLKVQLLYVDVLFGALILYNIYRFVSLFIRKIEINEFDHEIILFTPFRKKANSDDIEYINTIVNEDDEGLDRYFVEFKFKSKNHLIKFETTSNEQSEAIKSMFKKNQISDLNNVEEQ